MQFYLITDLTEGTVQSINGDSAVASHSGCKNPSKYGDIDASIAEAEVEYRQTGQAEEARNALAALRRKYFA